MNIYSLLLFILINEVSNKIENRKRLQYRTIQNILKELNRGKVHKFIDFLPYSRDHELEKSFIINLINQAAYYEIYTLVIFTTFEIFDNGGDLIQFNENKQHLFSLNLSQLDRDNTIIILYSHKNKYFRLFLSPMMLKHFNATFADSLLIDVLKENPYRYVNFLLKGLYRHIVSNNIIGYDLSIKGLFIIPVIILLCVGKCCFSKKARKERKLKLLKEKVKQLVIDMNNFDSDILKDKSCVICFREFYTDDTNIKSNIEGVILVTNGTEILNRQPIVRLKCEHYFHYACIFNWFKNKKSCPHAGKMYLIILFYNLH
jgi:hypothetical protein